ncbi:hypothetical protein HQ585_12440 [candidate division KSB1 bacterium]|nr:hypothetical protein [candidate division KSB1 bacterium]
MKTKSLVFLSILFVVACGNNQKTSQELLNSIFNSTYEHKIISKGDNLPNFNRQKDSLDLFLVALHERIEPKKFQKKAGWSDEMLKVKTQFLIDKGWLIDDDKGLRPTVFIVSDEQGKELYEYGMPLATDIAQSIEKEIPFIKEKFKARGLSDNYDFDSMSFLILSNVLLDNWQIMEMEATYLKKENRPERHGKFYYASIEENANHDFEPFGIYGNQYGKINDSTYLSIYGNNRTIVNKRLKSDTAFKDSVMNLALKLTPELYNFFDEIAKDYKPKLMEILNEQTDYSREVFEKTGYSDEIAFEEFFIWWYHFIYTDATNRLAKRNKLTIPNEGKFYYW